MATGPRPDCVQLMDAKGKRYWFPLENCREWTDMRGHIEVACSTTSVDVRIKSKQYDVVDEDENVLLPQFWHRLIRPAMRLRIRLWDVPSHFEETRVDGRPAIQQLEAPALPAYAAPNPNLAPYEYPNPVRHVNLSGHANQEMSSNPQTNPVRNIYHNPAPQPVRVQRQLQPLGPPPPPPPLPPPAAPPPAQPLDPPLNLPLNPPEAPPIAPPLAVSSSSVSTSTTERLHGSTRFRILRWFAGHRCIDMR